MNCKEATNAIAEQIIGLLHAIDSSTYSRPLDVFRGATLGQHFRHIFNFYQCLLNGVDAGTIDYGHRDRDPRLENDPIEAVYAFLEIKNGIMELEEHRLVKVMVDFSTHVDDSRPLVSSSIGRELMYAYDHALHHLAIIRIGLQAAIPDLVIDKNLGVAPSTVKFKAT